LDISSRIAINPANPFEERGLLGLAFHPGFANAGSPEFGKFYTYSSEIPTGTPDFSFPAIGGATTDHQNVITEWRVNSIM